MHHASQEAMFRGAYFSGSTIGLPDDAELSSASDIDVVIVTAQAESPPIPPDLQHALAPAFHAIIADLGITSTDALIRRAEDVIQFLPRLWETTEAILLANPDIVAE